jgi:hypothetical protein
MSADQSHADKVRRGMQLAREHRAGEHVEFNPECAHCKKEAKERGKNPAVIPDATRDVTSANISPEMPLPPDQHPGPEKTAEQKDREHQEAMRAAAEVQKEARVPIPPIAGKPGERGGDKDGDVVVHVLVDGFTALGAVWYRGQEIGIKTGGALDKLATDTTGHRWYEMTPEQQMARFNGVQQFGMGPWPYSEATDAETDEAYISALNSDDPEAMRRFEKEQQRKKMPPVPSTR